MTIPHAKIKILTDFDSRRTALIGLDYRDAPDRLKGFRDWLLSVETTRKIVEALQVKAHNGNLFREDMGSQTMIIRASTLEEIAAVGFEFIKMIAEEIIPASSLPHKYNIRPNHSSNSVQAYFDEVLRRYISPSIDYFRMQLVADDNAEVGGEPTRRIGTGVPVEITDSLARFREDHLDASRCAFVMMRFGRTLAHDEIIRAIRGSLDRVGLVALRADDKEYHPDLFSNVVTYMHGCAFGIAVLEKLEMVEFNPNVALEIGYMRALGKHVCLLKDSTLTPLPADLLGKLYRSVDAQSAADTIPAELGRWVRDWGFVPR